MSKIWNPRFLKARIMLETESVVPELIQRYMADCGTAITYTKTKDSVCVASLNKFCQKAAYWETEYIPEMLIQKHLIRRLNADIFRISGQYVAATEMLEKGFREQYHADRVFQYQMADLTVNLLLDIPCCRRILVPMSYSLAELHWVIQCLFYWENCHLHEFQTEEGLLLDTLFPEYSYLVEEDEFGSHDCTRIENVISLGKVFFKYHSLQYVYDMGDCWEHKIKFNGIETKYDSKIPNCISAEGTPPPEDVGGEIGYAELRSVLNDPQSAEYEEMKAWSDSMGWKPLDVEAINNRLRFKFM